MGAARAASSGSYARSPRCDVQTGTDPGPYHVPLDRPRASLHPPPSLSGAAPLR